MSKIAESTTDGWRGQPSKLWSERDVLEKALAFASRVKPNEKLVIGFDGRAGSKEIALLAARLFSNLKIDYSLSSNITPTPAVGRFVAAHKEVVLGLIFTASHNPPGDFGLKIRLSDGLPPLQTPLISKKIQTILASPSFDRLPTTNISDAINENYLESIGNSLESAVRKFSGEVIIDGVFGALGQLSTSLRAATWRRNIPAPFFFGITPDPVLRKEAEPEMAKAILERDEPNRAIVLMTDGDGDRLCMYTKESGYITSTEQAMALIHTGLPVKRVISTCVVESTLEEVADAHDIDYRTTQVGFKNIAAEWKTTERNYTIGIEPNGGFAYARTPTDFFERDGLATALLVLSHFGSSEALDLAIKKVRALRRFESRQFASFDEPERLVASISDRWRGAAVRNYSNVYELRWPEKWRILIRRSGTEPLTRCYVEAPDKVHKWLKNNL